MSIRTKFPISKIADTNEEIVFLDKEMFQVMGDKTALKAILRGWLDHVTTAQ